MDWQPRIPLPRSELVVGRIGLASSFGVGPEAVKLAFDSGINYFYWGSVRRPGFGEGIRRLARRDREGIAVALQSYARWPAALMRNRFESGLRRLGLDYADFLILGWHNRVPPRRLLDAALDLRERGRVRHLAISSHKRANFARLAELDLFDLFMVRYNAAHRGAERDVFPALPEGASRPALCAYTATRWKTLIQPRRVPAGEPVPGAGHCYRFCFSHPDVHMVLCGPSELEHVREACRALEAGPLDEDEMAWMRRVGDHVYRRAGLRRFSR